jgi:hypothetical protein
MASSLAYTEIKNHLIARMSPTQVIDFDELDDTLEQSNSNFICLQEGPSFEDEIGFGDPNNICVQEVSGISVFCFVPAPHSSSAARTFGDSVQTTLRLQTLNGVRVLDASPPEFDMMNDGLWTSVGISITVAVERHVAKT